MQDKIIKDLCKECGVSPTESELAYAIELLASLRDKDFANYNWLDSVGTFDDQADQVNLLLALLSIIVDLFRNQKPHHFEDKHVNRIVSQLVNINFLSRQPRVRALCCYVIEFFRIITEPEFDGVEWLREDVKSYPESMGSLDRIDELIRLFDNLININTLQESEKVSIYGVLTRLINLNSLSRSFGDQTRSNLKYHFSRLRNEYLNPEHVASPGFSQEGEDLVLKRLFSPDKTGFFVDVGAHHPTRFSNTFMLYKQGWRGINIDPLPGRMELFQSMRPRDINLECAVGKKDTGSGFVKYVQFAEPAYNSLFFENDTIDTKKIPSRVIETSKVPLRSLDSILEEYSSEFEHIDLLCIDVEGFEEDVFDGFSMERYFPDVIVVEVRGFMLDKKDTFPLYNFLVAAGYMLRSILYHSLIFTKNES